MVSFASPLRMVRLALVCVALLSLAACGGGGGDTGGGGGGGGGGSGNTDRGGFTLGATSASFKALRNAAAPADVRIPITVTGSAVAAVGAAFVGQQPPSWLFVNIEGTGRNLTLVLRATDTTLNAAQYTSTVTIGTADSAQNVLSSTEVRITYDVIIGMSVTATGQNTSFVLGSSQNTSQVTVTVGAGTPGKSWTITSDKAWVQVPAGTQQGDANLTLTIDGAATGQGPGGTAVAQVTLQNTAEPIDRHVVTVSAAIVAPAPIVSMNPVALGGTTGLGTLSQQVDVSTDTGTNAYPWTLTLDTGQTPGWVVSDVSSGVTSDARHATVTFNVPSTIGAAGNYSGTANFDVTVSNQTFRTSVPITLKWHGQRLVPQQAGAAFSSFPSGLRPATRTIKIWGSRGINNVPWTATSDQGWLTATPSGVTGGDLVLTANPAGLPQDQVNIAHVTLSSTSAGIERSETIRVGMWVGSADPTNVDVTIPNPSYALTVNPVEPYAYALINGVIHVYNVYSGAEITTFTGDFQNVTNGGVGGTSYPTSMDISSDGSSLYVANGLTQQVLVVNAATGAITATYQLQNANVLPLDAPLHYTRTNGYPLLWTPFSNPVIDLEAGAPVQLTQSGIPLFTSFESVRALPPDGSRIFTIDGGSTSTTISSFTTAFGVLGGRSLEVNVAGATFVTSGSFTRQMCVSADGKRLYSHNQGSPQQVAIDVEPPHFTLEVARPDPDHTSISAMDCNWNGRLYVGLSASVPQDNVFVADAAGNTIGSFLSGPTDSFLLSRQMGLSGDARRVVSARDEPGTPTTPVFSLHFYDVPP